MTKVRRSQATGLLFDLHTPIPMLIPLLSSITLFLLLTQCSPPRSGPDLSPLGGGLTAIAICLVVCSVVRALTKLVTRGESNADHASKPNARRNKP